MVIKIEKQDVERGLFHAARRIVEEAIERQVPGRSVDAGTLEMRLYAADGRCVVLDTPEEAFEFIRRLPLDGCDGSAGWAFSFEVPGLEALVK